MTQSPDVVLIDVRGVTGAVALRRLDDALASAAPTAVRGLFIVDLDGLGTGQDVFERAFGGRRLDSVVCVTVGPAGARYSSAPLRMTAALNTDGAVTLWAGAGGAVPWRMGSARVAASDGGDSNEPVTLDGLVQCLMTREVFDRVVEAGSQLPGRIASPGLLVLSGRVDADHLAAAEVAAVSLMVGRADAGRSGELDPPEFRPLLGGAGTGAEELPVSSGTPLDSARHAAWTSLRDVDAAMRRVSRLGYLAGPATAWSTVTAAGRALMAYRDAIAQAFDQGDGAGQPEETRRMGLERLGVRLERSPGLDRKTVADRLSDVLDGAIGRYPMLALVRWLRSVADRAAPQGSAAWTARLTSGNVLGQLSEPPPFPLRPAPPFVLACVAVCGFLAALPTTAGFPLLGGLIGCVVAAVWTVLAARCLAVQPASPDTVPAVLRPVLLAHPAAAVLGVAAGSAVGSALPFPLWASLPLALCAAAALAACLWFWWARAAHRWVAAVAVGEGRQLVDGWERTLSEVAVLEWQLGDTRRFTTDAARALAATFQQIADLLRGYAGEAGTGAMPAQATAGDDLAAVVARDLADAVHAAMEPGWEWLREGSLSHLRSDVADGFADLLEEYRRHRQGHHILQPPPFSRSRDGDRQLHRMLGSPIRLARLLASPPSEPFGQLCAAEDLPLLDAAPQSAHLIRFAPRAALDGVGGVSDVCLTANGRLAGVLRLVPLRPGTVELVWAHSTTNADEL